MKSTIARMSAIKAAVFIIASLWGPATFGQGYQLLHVFTNYSNGDYPMALMQANDGNLYGSTESVNNNVTVSALFRVTPEGQFSVLNIVENISATMVQGDDNFLYGVSLNGSTGDGSIFRMDLEGNLTNIFSFGWTNGSEPYQIVKGPNGVFYGTTTFGGQNGDPSDPYNDNYGTIFKITESGQFTTLVNFDGTNGEGPETLVLGSDGNIYGCTGQGGAYGAGTLYRVTPAGQLTVLYNFAASTLGEFPDLTMQAADGTLYGWTDAGTNSAILFKATTNGQVTTLKTWSAADVGGAVWVQGTDGTLYGTTTGTGSKTNAGTIFSINNCGQLTTLFQFYLTNGSYPFLINGNDGNFYGLTGEGGGGYGDYLYGYGTIFALIMPKPLAATLAGGSVVLSWPTNAAGFNLQWSAAPGSPTGWTDFTGTPAIVGTNYNVTDSISASSRIYRLKY